MSVLKSKKSLTAKEILAASDIQIELVNVPEWGGDVYVKSMTGAERDQYEAAMVTSKKPGEARVIDMSDLRAKLCSMTICDEGGKRLFDERDVRNLTKKSAAALQRIFKVAQRLSGIGDEDLKELTEGLEERPFDGSASDSQDI